MGGEGREDWEDGGGVELREGRIWIGSSRGTQRDAEKG